MPSSSMKIRVSRDCSSTSSAVSYYRNLKRNHRRHHFRKEHSSYKFRRTFKNEKRWFIPKRLSRTWQIHRSSNGRIYYYNIITDRSQWEKPSEKQLSSCRSSSKFRKHHKPSKRANAKLNIDDQFLTPISPPESEKIHIDHVDPIFTSDLNEITSSSFSHDDHLKSKKQKETIKNEINEHLSSIFIQSDLCLSESTVNAIRQLEYPLTNINVNTFDDNEEKQGFTLNNSQVGMNNLYYGQIYFISHRLISLRADLCHIRMRYAKNQFQLFNFRSLLFNQSNILKTSSSIY